MKKFIIKTSFFVSPFLIFYFINTIFYKKNEGDLARLGYIYNNPSPSSEVAAQYKALEEKYIRISEADLNQNIKVDILTIGDLLPVNKRHCPIHLEQFEHRRAKSC